MDNQINVVKFYEAFARIIAEREGVCIDVKVRLKDDSAQVLDTVPEARHRKRYKLNKQPML